MYSVKQWFSRSDCSLRMSSWRRSAALLVLCASSPLAANTPPPPPQKLAEDFSFTCLMLSEMRPATSLSISIRYEPIVEKNAFYRTAYWWSLLGDSERFPSNKSFANMRSLESEQPISDLSFQTTDSWKYYYSLYYAVEERYPSFFYVPDHLVVRRRRANASVPVEQLVGIGECRLNSVKPAH